MKKKTNQIKRVGNPFFDEIFELKFITYLDEDAKSVIYKSLLNAGVIVGEKKGDVDTRHLQTAEEAGEDKNYKAYLHYDDSHTKIDNKLFKNIYVGISFQDNLQKGRWKNGDGYINSNEKFKQALNNTPWNLWEYHGLIADNLSQKAARALEEVMIEFFDSFESGLNKNRGGEGRPIGVKFSDEQREKMKKNHVRKDDNTIVIAHKDGTTVMVKNQSEAALIGNTSQSNVSDYINGKKPQRKNGDVHFYRFSDYLELQKKAGDGFVY